jgi:hypothetical protein
MKTLDSSYIRSLDYDRVTHILIVHFRDGAVVKYFSVDPRTYRAIVNAESHGGKFHDLMSDKKFIVIKEAA